MMTSSESIPDAAPAQSPVSDVPGRGRKRLVYLLLAALWGWAILGCLDEWRDNPMYSYGWFVPPLVVFFAWRRLDEPFTGTVPFESPRLPRHARGITLLAAVLALAVLPVELFRNELPDDRLNNWCLAFLAVGATLAVARWLGGSRLAITLAFPIAFFLTAVAWPKRYESPVTVGLQKFVAAVIVEVLHVIGVVAQPQGTTIYLRGGPVGIAEACSGVRSLQASLMISLAIGELFFLRWPRRLLLVALCAAMAMVLNLGRTLSLCLITEYHGADAMHRAHDRIGDAILLLLPILAWGLGWLVARGNGAHSTERPPRKPADGSPPPPSAWVRLGRQIAALDGRRLPQFLPALAIGIAAFLTYHGWLAILDLRDPPQREPFFSIRDGEATRTSREEMNPDLWTALSPTLGGTYLRSEPGVPGGKVSLYHFFWKPAAANRWVTGHRPDICMPAGGWKDGDVLPLEVTFDGHPLQMHVFRFAGVGQRALQVWGIWRNGEPIHMDFFDRPILEWSLLTGKSRSAVEVVSCVIPFEEGEPPVDLARAILAEVVDYHRPDSAAPATPGPAAEARRAQAAAASHLPP